MYLHEPLNKLAARDGNKSTVVSTSTNNAKHRHSSLGCENPVFVSQEDLHYNSPRNEDEHHNLISSFNESSRNNIILDKENNSEWTLLSRNAALCSQRNVEINLNNSQYKEQSAGYKGFSCINHALPHAKLKVEQTASISKATVYKSCPRRHWREILPPLVPNREPVLNQEKNLNFNNFHLVGITAQKSISTQTELNSFEFLPDKFCHKNRCNISDEKLLSDPQKNKFLCCLRSGSDSISPLEYGKSLDDAINPARIGLYRSYSSDLHLSSPPSPEVVAVTDREHALDAWALNESPTQHRGIRLRGYDGGYGGGHWGIHHMQVVEEDGESLHDSEDLSSAPEEVDKDTIQRSHCDSDDTGEVEASGEFGYIYMGGNLTQQYTINETVQSPGKDDFYYLTYGSEIEENEDYQTKYKKLLAQSAIPAGADNLTDVKYSETQSNHSFSFQPRMQDTRKAEAISPPPDAPRTANDVLPSRLGLDEVAAVGSEIPDNSKVWLVQHNSNQLPKGIIRQMIQQFEGSLCPLNENVSITKPERINNVSSDIQNRERRNLYVKNTRSSKRLPLSLNNKRKTDTRPLDQIGKCSNNHSTNSKLFHMTNNRLKNNLSTSHEDILLRTSPGHSGDGEKMIHPRSGTGDSIRVASINLSSSRAVEDDLRLTRAISETSLTRGSQIEKSSWLRSSARSDKAVAFQKTGFIIENDENNPPITIL